MPSLALICSSWRRARLRGGRNARGWGGSGMGARRWCAAAGLGGRERGMTESVAVPPSVPPLPAQRCCRTSEPPGARARALPSELAPASPRRARGRCEPGPPAAANVFPQSGPSRPRKGGWRWLRQGGHRAGVCSPARGWGCFGESACWVGTGGEEASGRLLSKSSLAPPATLAKLPVARRTWGLGSGLDGQLPWAGSKGSGGVRKALGQTWARTSRWQVWTPPTPPPRDSGRALGPVSLIAPSQVVHILRLGFQLVFQPPGLRVAPSRSSPTL